MVMLLCAIYNTQLLSQINREKTKITGCYSLFGIMMIKVNILTMIISSTGVAQYKTLRM
jgi:hypothetical protein